MTCEYVRMPGGGVAIVCGPRRKGPKCHLCGKRATLECDYPVKHGKTCDKALCAICAVKVAPGIDHCPGHPPIIQDDLFG